MNKLYATRNVTVVTGIFMIFASNDHHILGMLWNESDRACNAIHGILINDVCRVWRVPSRFLHYCDFLFLKSGGMMTIAVCAQNDCTVYMYGCIFTQNYIINLHQNENLNVSVSMFISHCLTWYSTFPGRILHNLCPCLFHTLFTI